MAFLLWWPLGSRLGLLLAAAAHCLKWRQASSEARILSA
jgi:hypothetical protein